MSFPPDFGTSGPPDPPGIPTAPAALAPADAAALVRAWAAAGGPIGPVLRELESAEMERLRVRVAELEAERDEYARVALAVLSGIVGTPEKGYLRDGGPGQLAADLRTLRAKVTSLQAQLDLTRRHIPKDRS